MSMFPHTVTLYNVETVPGENMREVTVNQITVLRGVLLDDQQAAAARTSGPENTDAATLYIPRCVKAVDGADIHMDDAPAKIYVGPKVFEGAEDKSVLWTLATGKNCFFVKGEVVEPDLSFQEINRIHDGVYKVTSVKDRCFGSADLQHFEVGGA